MSILRCQKYHDRKSCSCADLENYRYFFGKSWCMDKFFVSAWISRVFCAFWGAGHFVYSHRFGVRSRWRSHRFWKLKCKSFKFSQFTSWPLLTNFLRDQKYGTRTRQDLSNILSTRYLDGYHRCIRRDWSCTEFHPKSQVENIWRSNLWSQAQSSNAAVTQAWRDKAIQNWTTLQSNWTIHGLKSRTIRGTPEEKFMYVLCSTQSTSWRFVHGDSDVLPISCSMITQICL